MSAPASPLTLLERAKVAAATGSRISLDGRDMVGLLTDLDTALARAAKADAIVARSTKIVNNSTATLDMAERQTARAIIYVRLAVVIAGAGIGVGLGGFVVAVFQ